MEYTLSPMKLNRSRSCLAGTLLVLSPTLSGNGTVGQLPGSHYQKHQNPFYTGKVRRKDERLPGAHQASVSEEVFQIVQLALRWNSSRSETLHTHPDREYLLKGLVRCAHCLMLLWAQTLNSGSRLYREQPRSRSHVDYPADGKSIRCDVPDDQIGKIVSAIVLPDAGWTGCWRRYTLRMM